jgi:ferredoxin
MPSRTALLYFSGTGNTELVVDLLSKSLLKHCQCESIRIEDILHGKIPFDPDRYDTIGIGYPILGFNAPPIVFDFIKSLPQCNNKDAFVFSTCAGPFYLNDIASYFLKRACAKKGLRIFYERQFYMPPNIAVRYRDEVIKQLCDIAAVKCAKMAGEIADRIFRVRNDRFIPWLFFWLRWTERISWKTLPLDFHVKRNCTLCGICVANCPKMNIRIQSGKIRFGLKCIACYRCVYRCPQRSIAGWLYNFAILKKGYDIRRIVNDKVIKGDFISGTTKGYYRTFLPYLNEDR